MTNERRKEIERLIVAKTVDTFLAAGFQLGVHDGEDYTVRHSTNRDQILSALGTTDEDYLVVLRDSRWFGQVDFVYGNEGNTVICDNSTKLEEILAPVTAYAESFEAEVHPPVTVGPEAIDITPRGCATPEGAKRVAEAMQVWGASQAEMANACSRFLGEHAFLLQIALDANAPEAIEDLDEIRLLDEDMKAKQDAFLRAVAGR